MCKHWKIMDSLSYYIQLVYAGDVNLPGENQNII